MTGDHAVAVELAQIRGDIGTGFASVDGKLALLVQRGDHTDERLRAGEAVTERLAVRVTALERRVWTASGMAATLGGLGGFLAAYLMH